MLDEPLTHEEFGLIYAAGWRNIGASFGPPARIRFTHSDGRAVNWTRDEVRAEIARFRAVLASLPALLAVADAARALEAATTASLFRASYGSSIDDGPSRAALWAALAALETPQ